MFTYEAVRDICEELIQQYWVLQTNILVRVVDGEENLLSAKETVGKGKGAKEFRDALIEELKKREVDDVN